MVTCSSVVAVGEISVEDVEFVEAWERAVARTSRRLGDTSSSLMISAGFKEQTNVS